MIRFNLVEQRVSLGFTLDFKLCVGTITVTSTEDIRAIAASDRRTLPLASSTRRATLHLGNGGRVLGREMRFQNGVFQNA